MGTHRLVYVWPACVCIHNHKHIQSSCLVWEQALRLEKRGSCGEEGEVPLRVPSSISYCRGIVRILSLVRLRQCPESGELIGLAYRVQVWGFAEHGRPKAALASPHPAWKMLLPLEIPRCRITSKWRNLRRGSTDLPHRPLLLESVICPQATPAGLSRAGTADPRKMAAISTTEGSPSSSGQFGSFFRVRGTTGTFYRVETLPRGPSGYTFNLIVAATSSAGRASQRRGEHASRSQDDIMAGAEPCSVWAGRRVLVCRCECVCWVGRGGRGQIYGVLTKAEHRYTRVRSSPAWAPAPCVSCRPWSAPTLPPSAMDSFTLPTAWKFLGELPWNKKLLLPVSPVGLCTMSGSGAGGGNFLRLARGQDTGPSWRLHSSSRLGSRGKVCAPLGNVGCLMSEVSSKGAQEVPRGREGRLPEEG